MTRPSTTLWDYDTTANNSIRLWHDRQQLYETMTRPPTTLWDYDTTANNKFINNISCRYIDAAGLVGRKILVLREKENIWNGKGIWKKLIWKGPLTTAPNTLFLIILESCYFPNKHDALKYMLRRATWWDFQTLYFHNDTPWYNYTNTPSTSKRGVC
jgi:hypothetical protein